MEVTTTKRYLHRALSDLGALSIECAQGTIAMVRTVVSFWHSATEFFVGHDSKEDEGLEPLGEYFADYSELTPDELLQAKNACADHIAKSKVISVKSGL